MPHVLFVCTGNAARSVMAATYSRALAPDWQVTSAGTHAVEDQPISRRTTEALATLGFRAHGHRSHQLVDADVEVADVIVVFEPGHLIYMRRVHPEAAARTGTLPRLARDLPGTVGPLPERIATLHLDQVSVEAWEEVVDPAGGDLAVVTACAHQVYALTTDLIAAIGTTTATARQAVIPAE